MCTHGARKASAVRLRRLQVVQGSAAGQTLSPPSRVLSAKAAFG